ncbi:MAG: hypothetical protein ACYTFK_09000 [Planctomycetota bacterium]|jgi:hypothetical protein
MAVKTLKNLSVPDQSDCIFTLPEFKSWSSLLDENKSSLSAVNDRDVSRTELVNIAAEYTRRTGFTVSHLKNEADIIVTGHQPNWHHCGIFAKNVITDKLARQTGGTAVQLVLDHDICNTSIFLPESDNNDFVRFKTVPLERKQRDIPLELISVPSKEELRKFIESVSKTKESFCCGIWHQELHYIFESSVLCRNIADLITLLQTRLNAACGLEIIYLPVSLMSRSDSFANFLYSIICDAARFVRVYNQAIKNKRKTDNLKPNQTIRLLKTDYLNNIIELPFWLVWQTGKRASLYVSLNNRNLHIGTADSIIGTIDSSGDKKQQLIEILSKNKCVIRPKAVTLTLFARLYLADLFVHGTGSGNYEYITDHLIGNYYRISNVNFGVATATMTLLAGAGNLNLKISKEILNYREFFFGLFPKGRLEKLICSQRG